MSRRHILQGRHRDVEELIWSRKRAFSGWFRRRLVEISHRMLSASILLLTRYWRRMMVNWDVAASLPVQWRLTSLECWDVLGHICRVVVPFFGTNTGNFLFIYRRNRRQLVPTAFANVLHDVSHVDVGVVGWMCVISGISCEYAVNSGNLRLAWFYSAFPVDPIRPASFDLKP